MWTYSTSAASAVRFCRQPRCPRTFWCFNLSQTFLVFFKNRSRISNDFNRMEGQLCNGTEKTPVPLPNRHRSPERREKFKLIIQRRAKIKHFGQILKHNRWISWFSSWHSKLSHLSAYFQKSPESSTYPYFDVTFEKFFGLITQHEHPTKK